MAEEEAARRSGVFHPGEEKVNAVTHGMGMLLSIVGAVVLMLRVVPTGRGGLIAACGAYALALVAVYTTSTLSHAFSQPWLLRLLRRLDQGFIYLLIVATYTPISVAYLHGVWWSAFLGLMWTIAFTGFVFKQVSAHRVAIVAIGSYVVLGWMPVIAAPAVIKAAPPFVLQWILIGGLCYTFGTVFLLFDKLVRHFHAVWHLLVIAGSSFHFFAILFIASTAG